MVSKRCERISQPSIWGGSPPEVVYPHPTQGRPFSIKLAPGSACSNFLLNWLDWELDTGNPMFDTEERLRPSAQEYVLFSLVGFKPNLSLLDIYIPRPSRCAFFLPLAEKAIYCVVCSKKSLFLLKVLLQNLAKMWSANVAFWSGMSPLGRARSPFRLHPGFAKQQNTQECTEAKKCVVCTKRSLWPKQHKKGILRRAQVYIYISVA